MLRKRVLLAVSVFTLSLLFAESLIAQPRPKKKIIEYGWDVPYPDFVRDNLREMEKRPFEGLLFRTNEFNHAFDVRPWNKSDLQPQLDTLAQIQWQKFTDNLLTLYAANKWKMDWFNEHNVYYALTTSDEYIWCYSERMNWWLPPEKAGPNGALPPGVEEALVSARQKYDAGKPLGYDIADMIKAGHQKRREIEAKNLKPAKTP